MSHRCGRKFFPAICATASMELDSDGSAAAFHRCGSKTGADRVLADAWSSSLARAFNALFWTPPNPSDSRSGVPIVGTRA
jgi:hypothetical protein